MGRAFHLLSWGLDVTMTKLTAAEKLSPTVKNTLHSHIVVEARKTTQLLSHLFPSSDNHSFMKKL